MSEKDRFGNNLRRGCRVRDLRNDGGGKVDGTYLGAGLEGKVLVQWDDQEEEELVLATSILVIERRFR